MSGNPAIVVGAKLPLTLTLVDAEAGHDVVASVTDSFGKQHVRTKLIDVGSGVYVNNEVQMPDVPFVVVQYFVQDSDKYEVASERFDSIPKPMPPEKMIDGQVIKRAKVKDIISGDVIHESSIKE